MPFTVNVGPYVGGQLWQEGLLQSGKNISEGIMKAVAENKKIEEEQGADQVILDYGKRIGLVTPEIEANYIKGSHSAKTGIVGGLLRQFTMKQQQDEAAALEKHRQAQENQAAAELDLKRAEATWTPPPEAIAAAKETDTPYLPIGPGKYALRSPKSEDQTEAVDYKDPVSGRTFKVPIRSALGQKLLEKSNPEMALNWKTGLTKDELFNKDLHEAGTLDQQGNFVPIKPDWQGKYDPKAGTHIRIGGGSILSRQQFNFYQNRLKNTDQAPTTAQATPKKELSDQDKQALDWATKNPTDPRAAAIKAKLGM